MPVAIRCHNLGKTYQLDPTAAYSVTDYRTLRDDLVDGFKAWLRWLQGKSSKPKMEEFWALRDLSFEVESGEVLGIIGRNGAGKSTLLKILSRITKPATGRAELFGRVGSLLEVGTGFHPELTGRENIYLNGAILGMRRREIERKFDEIVEFAGVAQFLETPVKRYSSGMYVRLAFSVAAHLDPEILLVDEVLAVGDHAFQQKCIGRMNAIARSGRTVLLVTHNLPMLSRLCPTALWIDHGRFQQYGATADVVAAYCKAVGTSIHEGDSIALDDHPGRPAGFRPILKHVALFGEDANPTSSVPLGGTVIIEIECSCPPQRSDTGIIIDICDQFGTVLARANSRVQCLLDFSTGDHNRVRCAIHNLRLLPGCYLLNLAVGDNIDYLDRVERALRFTVEPTDIYGTGHIPTTRNGVLALETTWETAMGHPSWSKNGASAAPGLDAKKNLPA